MSDLPDTDVIQKNVNEHGNYSTLILIACQRPLLGP
jgi:hypothetical protein